jgi:hypothetical protein
MVTFKALIQHFDQNADKTGWYYVLIPNIIAQELNAGIKVGYRVKGYMDKHVLSQISLLPVGNGDYLLPVNASMRKATGKSTGATLELQMEVDLSEVKLSADLLACLEDEPTAKAAFEALSKGHKRYFSQWVESAKTIETKTKRIYQSLYGLSNGFDFGATVRYFKNKDT